MFYKCSCISVFLKTTHKQQNFGALKDLSQYVFDPEGMPIRLESKLFLRDRMQLTGMEVSVNKDEPGTGMTFYHRHKQNEELYIFISGEGEMEVDGERFPVSEGSVVRVDPSASRAWWNTGSSELYYVCVQAVAGSMRTSTADDAEPVEGTVPWMKSEPA
ncbi:MAG: mannose-6-phosphate isomerase-like protein (cupin superfamily) [Candidatus Omnitrophota bacterium]